MCKLESLKTVTALGLLADNIEHRVYELCTFCVVSLGPVIARAALTEHEIVGSEDLTERTRSYRVHRTRLEVNENGTWYILATCGHEIAFFLPQAL
jgi:hypothetical protein